MHAFSPLMWHTLPLLVALAVIMDAEHAPNPGRALLAHAGSVSNKTLTFTERKEMFLKLLNLNITSNPNDKYQTMAEVTLYRANYTSMHVFADFLALINSSYVMRFNRNVRQFSQYNVALFKTHKTGSTTLASVLYRVAARHHLRLFTFSKASVIPRAIWAAWARVPPIHERYTYNMAIQHLSGE